MGNLSSPELRAKAEVAHLARFFEQSGNAAAAWRCWHLAKTWDLPVPAVVATEVDRFAAAIAEVTDAALAGDKEVRLDSKTISRLWGAVTRGKEDPTQAIRVWNRDIGVAVAVHLRRREMSAFKAYQSVGKEWGMSAENVIRLYKKHRAEIDTADVED